MTEMLVLTLVGFLRALALIYDVVSYIPYVVLFRPKSKLLESNRVKAKSVSGEAAGPWRSVEALDTLATSLFPQCTTVDDLFVHAVEQFAAAKCLGTRELLSEEEERQRSGRVFKKVILGDYQWQSFEQVFSRISYFGSGLLALGQLPRSKLVIFAETRAEWMIAAQACFKYNFPVVTLYSTLGQDAIVHGINETEVTHVITSYDLLPKFNGVLDRMPFVTHLVVMTSPGQRPSLKDKPSSVTVLTMEDVEQEGAKLTNIQTPVTKPKPDDLAVIMYTSGSTGLPKGRRRTGSLDHFRPLPYAGVVITHHNLMCGMSGQCERILDLGKREDDIYIGYLPLAHVLELTAEISCLSHGVRIGYSSPLTLTDQSSKIMRGCKGDISVLRPTLLAAVPVIMDRLYKTVWDKVNSGGVVGKAVFQFAYDYKLKQITNGYDTPLLNHVIFKKLASALGGRIRLMLCGGAPLSGATQRFMRICFCSPVLQGYGLTETCGAATVAEAADLNLGHVGQPLLCSEIKLKDWAEGGYTSLDQPLPRGEILIGGGNIAQGYYKMDQQSKEDFIRIGDQRYFCTGDIGQMEPSGTLSVIDRKKDLVKLQMGEYVSLGKVETAIKMCPLVDQVCVCADSLKMNAVCLVVPNEKQLRQLCARLEGLPDEFPALCALPDVVALVTKTINDHAAESKLERFETPTAFTLCPEPWTPDSNLVTDAFKLKRKNIDKMFAKEIAAMYS